MNFSICIFHLLLVGICLFECDADDQYINFNEITITQGAKLGNIETNFVMEVIFELDIKNDCSSDFCGVLLVGGSDTSYINRYPGMFITGPGNYLNIEPNKLLIQSDRGGSFVHETDAIFTASNCVNNGPIRIYFYQDNGCAVLKVNDQVIDVKHGDFYNAIFYPDYQDPTNFVEGPRFNIDEPIYASDVIATPLDGTIDNLCIYTYADNKDLDGREYEISNLCQ